MMDWAARVVRLGFRVQRSAENALTALGAGLGASLSVAERQALTLALYEAAGGEDRVLFPWEIAWFRASLPPVPARLLVAGAGAGAEVSALAGWGYRVAATEPVARLARQCARAERVWMLDHERLGALGGERFEAVIFGWGSLTHVLTPAGRQKALEAAADLTEGPILASFWTRASAGGPPGGWADWGRAIGASIGRRRGLPPPSAAERFFPWCGFGAVIEPAEVEALGAAIHRRVAWGVGPYPHVAWLPLLPAGPKE